MALASKYLILLGVRHQQEVAPVPESAASVHFRANEHDHQVDHHRAGAGWYAVSHSGPRASDEDRRAVGTLPRLTSRVRIPSPAREPDAEAAPPGGFGRFGPVEGLEVGDHPGQRPGPASIGSRRSRGARAHRGARRRSRAWRARSRARRRCAHRIARGARARLRRSSGRPPEAREIVVREGMPRSLAGAARDGRRAAIRGASAATRDQGRALLVVRWRRAVSSRS